VLTNVDKVLGSTVFEDFIEGFSAYENLRDRFGIEKLVILESHLLSWVAKTRGSS
jgi:hypothetical protein